MIGRPGPLSAADRIVVDRHDQPIGFLRGRLQIADVADVQQVEAAVGEGDAQARRAIACDDVARPTSSTRVLEKRHAMAGSGSADRRESRLQLARRSTVAVPRFITTRPPA